jgi:hypothetical protein
MREAGAGGEGTQGQLTSSKGPKRMRNLRHEKGAAFTSKLFPFSKYQIRTRLILYVFRIKKSSLCRLKINHMSESETCVYSWYTGPHGSEQ